MNYIDFLKTKIDIAKETGFEVEPENINKALKPHQRDAVAWALRGGRRALFESYGLGKTVQELEFLHQVLVYEGKGKALLVCPLGVKQEFTRDAVKVLGYVAPDTDIYKDHELYRIKGLNNLIFDGQGVDMLGKYNVDQIYLDGKSDGIKLMEGEYEKGLNDAWEAAMKMIFEKENGGFSPNELSEMFKSNSIPYIFANNTATEAIAKIKAYEEQKKAEEEQIKVGDEVLPLEPSEDVVIVTRKWNNDYGRHCIDTINRDGKTWIYLEKDVKRQGVILILMEF